MTGKKFNETSLLENKDFYSHLNMEDITDAGYTLAKGVSKYFEIKNLGEYHDLYVRSNWLLRLYLRTFKISVLKYMKLTLQKFFQLLE